MDEKDNVESIHKTHPKGSKWEAAEIQNDIINHVAKLKKRGHLEDTYPQYFKNIRIMRNKGDEFDSIYQIGANKEISLLPFGDYDHLMLDFYRWQFKHRFSDTPMSVTMQRSTTKVLYRYLNRLESKDVKIFAYRKEDVYCWKKLNFDLIDSKTIEEELDRWRLDNDSPAASPVGSFAWAREAINLMADNWLPIIDRCGNSKAMLSWFGSLMVRESKNPQFLYLFGDGGDSKGTIINAMQSIFGEKLYHTENLPEKGSGALRFFTANLEGKLLLICPDNGKSDIFTPFFMALTGGDPLAIEAKGKQTRNGVNHIRSMLVSNWRPIIPNKQWAKRRIILVPVRPYTGVQDPDYSDKLVLDSKAFLSICKAVYDAEPAPMQIEQDDSVYVDNTNFVDTDIVSFIEEYFDVGVMPPQEEGKPPKWDGVPFVSVAFFNEYCRQYLRNETPLKVRDVISKITPFNMVPHVKTVEGRQNMKVLYGLSPRYGLSKSPLGAAGMESKEVGKIP